ncbi:MAG: Phage Mu protein F like protein [Euryarchaeota archaeon ADurb.Bin009]|nr:MAG: Phage Mu protein F like protein [Euryarchaeota archaeon ADurb.Bin009]
MPTDEQRKLIEEVLADRQEAIAAALIEEAETLVPVAVDSTLGELRRRTADKFTRQIVAGITEEQVAAYRAQVAKGGTDIIERVVTALGDGRVSITTRRTFKPWLADMATRDQNEILRIIGEGQRGGMHPRQIARELRGYFDGTEHNAVTAARTEAQKLRTDARVATYLKTGVHYLEYIAVDDGKARPDHLARDGKIYPIDKAPWLGEPNCRCTLIDADYRVEEEGAGVEESDSITLTPEELEV